MHDCFFSVNCGVDRIFFQIGLSAYNRGMRKAWLLCASFVFFALGSVFVPLVSRAQIKEADIVQRYPIANETFLFGDIVVYDRETLHYRLSTTRVDPFVFGVAIENPIFLLDDGTANVPITRNGETVLNVVAENGPIRAGDYITTSSVRGKGERANADDIYLVGIALGDYAGLPDEIVGEESGTSYGRVPALLSVGHVSKVQEVWPRDSVAGAQTGVTEATLLNVIQYIVAAFIALGSVFIAFRNFGPNIRTGLASIGRNPLAKSSIQSMVLLNVVLMVLISAGGFFVSLAILLLPI